MDERIGAALGAGAYAGGSTALVGVLLGAVTAQIELADVLVAGAALGVLIAFATARRYRRTEAVARRTVSGALLAVPAVCTIGAVAVGSPLESRSSFLALAAAALLTLLGWLLLRRTACTIRARRIVENAGNAPALATLPDPVDRTPSQRQRQINVAFAALLVVWSVAAFVEGSEQWWFPILLLAFPLPVFVDPLQDVTVTEAGVLVERRFGARLYEWSAFAGFYYGEDRLVLLRPAWWRDDLVFDRESVSEDALAVVAEALPRAPGPAVPVGGFRQPLGNSSPDSAAER